jgi:hypothetical protein
VKGWLDSRAAARIPVPSELPLPTNAEQEPVR